jgi:hypothetical protein
MFQSYFAPHIGSLTHINMRLAGKLVIKPSCYEEEPRVHRLVEEGGMDAVMADTDHQVSAREKPFAPGLRPANRPEKHYYVPDRYEG